MKKYLIRLDDACPTMNRKKWHTMDALLDYYDVRPIVGVIPNCEDEKQMIDPPDPHFWDMVHQWCEKGWAVAVHGNDHCYISNKGMMGINPMWRRSEFSGLPLYRQKDKISRAVSEFRNNGLEPTIFFAPSHTFDSNTLEALKSESKIRIISDTIGRYPYKKDDFWFIPQITGRCIDMPISGFYTFCFHPNTMSDKAFSELEAFLAKHHEKFVSFSKIELNMFGKKKAFDKFLSWSFFAYRKIRGLK